MPPTVIKVASECETASEPRAGKGGKHGRSLTLDADTLIASSPYRVCKKTKTIGGSQAVFVTESDIVDRTEATQTTTVSPITSTVSGTPRAVAGKENKGNTPATDGQLDSCTLATPRAPRERRPSTESDTEDGYASLRFHNRPTSYHAQPVSSQSSTLTVDDCVPVRSRSNSQSSHTRRRSTVDDEDRDLLFSPLAHDETGDVCHHHVAHHHHPVVPHVPRQHENAKVMEEYIAANGHAHLSYSDHGRHVDVDIDVSLASAEAVVVRNCTVEAEASAEQVEEEEEEEYGEFDPYHFISRLPPPTEEQLARKPMLEPKALNSAKVTLVLDLDETLVHCATDPMANCDFTFNVAFNLLDYNIYVRKRPFMDDFVRRVADHFELVIFTASQQVYADRLLDLLDPERTWSKNRLFRDACVDVEGNFVKDLTILGRDLSSVVIVDNSPHAYGYQIDNGIPIESWFDDDNDTELLKMADFLLTIANLDDVRPRVCEAYAQRSLVEAHLADANAE